MNKYYFVISLAIIVFIGSYSVFNAGYNPEEPAEEVEQVDELKKEETDDGLDYGEDNEKDIEDEGLTEKEGEEEDKDEPGEDKADNSLTNLIEDIDPHPESRVKCRRKIKGIPSPKAVEFHPSGDEFWVASLMNKKYGLVVFDSETGERLAEIKLPDGGGVEISFDSNGSYGYVSQMETGRIFKINTQNREIEDTYQARGTWTKVVKLEGGYIFASNWSSNDISKVDSKTGQLLEKIPTAATPRGMHIDNDFLYVAGFANGEIRRHNLKTGEEESLIMTGGAMRDLVGTEKHIYGSDMASGTIYRLEKETGRVDKFVETENNPNTIRIIEDKNILVVSNRGINHHSGNYNIPGPEWGTILFYSLEDGKLLEALVGGNQPTGLAIYEARLVYSNFLDGELILCDLPPTENFLKGPSERVKSYKQDIKKQ